MKQLGFQDKLNFRYCPHYCSFVYAHRTNMIENAAISKASVFAVHAY